MADKKVKALPDKITVAGIPFEIVYNDEIMEASNYVSLSDYTQQQITVRSTLPFPRQLSYVIGEIGRRLLDASGVSERRNNAISPIFGTVLYRFIRENNFDWIYKGLEASGPPSTVFINGMPYTVTFDKDSYLDAKDLLGEVDYTQLTIRLHGDLKNEGKAVVFLHEVAHAILYEARCLKVHNDESIIEPLSYLLYQLFKQNDFSFAYNG